MTTVLSLTDKAASKALALLQKTGKPGAALRIQVISGGCSGMEYKLEPDFDPPKPNDQVINDKGVKIYLDKSGAFYIKGSEMDYVTSLMGSAFKFKNPNAVAECSCGESFTV